MRNKLQFDKWLLHPIMPAWVLLQQLKLRYLPSCFKLRKLRSKPIRNSYLFELHQFELRLQRIDLKLLAG